MGGGLRHLAGIAGSALLLALYARGGAAWILGTVVLVPWLLASERAGLRARLAGAAALSMAWMLAAFAWFAPAIAAYTGIGAATALALLVLAGPLMQPQILALVLARHWAARRFAAPTAALAGTAAWVGCEAVVPKLFGDTLAHGLAPSLLLRQAADLGGTAGLTALLLLVNQTLAAAITAHRAPARAIRALAVAALVLAAWAGYGHWRIGVLAAHHAGPAASLRVGMVQGAYTDYEARRRAVGTHAVVREVLDIHYALSRDAIARDRVDALLWSETVYPTPFGHPRSEAGAEFDREILAFAEGSGVALVFGTYDVDADGEYNAAAFLAPGPGLLGRYRKTHPFPLTEHVPGWLDGPRLRAWLPWAGTWRAGDGARVLPLTAADGRALQVVPLICRDVVDPALTAAGARLGAQAIVTLSNDAWFTHAPLGAELHLAVATFRSIETRLPQLRVTTNGITAFIDPSGEVLARTAIGDRAVLAGAVPIRDPPPTPYVRWGDWVGGALLAGLALLLLGRSIATRVQTLAARPVTAVDAGGWRARVHLLGDGGRRLAAALRLLAGLGLAWIALRMLLWDGLQVTSLTPIRIFLAAVVLPGVLAWLVVRSGRAEARVDAGRLVLTQRDRRIEVPLAAIRALTPWRWSLPASGVHLELASGRRWPTAIAVDDPQALACALRAAGAALAEPDAAGRRRLRLAALRAATQHPILDHPLLRFGIYPLVPALPAFRLHQYIAYGGTFGEWHSFGFTAWAGALGLWWAAWAIGLSLYAAALQFALEAVTWAANARAPAHAAALRRILAPLLRLAYYAGPPLWLGSRLLVP